MIKFAIRDDDINYFTNPQDLVKNYSDIWDMCPISLSVVPFHACTKTSAIPKKYWSGNGVFPIGKNVELVNFLKERVREGRVSMMLHGYSHKDSSGTYEFDVDGDLSEKVKEGKEYLESLFNIEIKVFVPPHNTISRRGLDAVIKNGLDLVNIPSFRLGKRHFHILNIIPFVRQKMFKWRYGGKYPYVLNCYDHKEVDYYPLTPDVHMESLREDFDFCYKMSGRFILATHYWEFNAKQRYNPRIPMRYLFYDFWKYINNFKDVRFVTVNQIFED